MEVGDTGLLHLTSWPKQTCPFYKVTSSAIRVHVKCRANAVISLAANTGKGLQFEYAILIMPNFRNVIKIKHANKFVTSEVLPNFMSHLEYSIFDINWNEGKFSFHVGDFSFKHDTVGPEITYVTFGVKSGSDPVHWKVQLTPYQVPRQLQQITLKGMPDHKWIRLSVVSDSTKQLEMPEDALIGGFERDRLYVIRANHRGSLTPGKFSVRDGFAFIPWGGAENKKSEFEVLCTINCKWVIASYNMLPVDALEAGHSEDRNERLYIGRAYHMGHLIIGKVQPSHSCCYIPYEEKEVSIRQYEVLVECKKPHEKYAANAFSIPEIAPRYGGDGIENDEEDPIDRRPIY